MKALAIIQYVGVSVWLLTGCASHPVALLAPIGPDNASYDAASLHDTGYLQVFTSTEAHTIGDGPLYYTHTGYNIHDMSGRRIRYVRNHVGNMDNKPTAVQIASGRYYVVAKSATHGRLSVQVVIEPGKTTEVYLDGSWRSVPTSDTNSIVFMPNGDAVGWRDTAAGVGR
ncbi:MAG TPA: hypothetical protein VK742_04590 [Candidatus Sulfotelmatobacter sp.]|nr:hypothetical protein [Candidatus Sulfotelmatobacter sp.]